MLHTYDLSDLHYFFNLQEIYCLIHYVLLDLLRDVAMLQVFFMDLRKCVWVCVYECVWCKCEYVSVWAYLYVSVCECVWVCVYVSVCICVWMCVHVRQYQGVDW